MRESSPDHDSGEENRGSVTFLDIFHVTRLFQCSTHVSQPHSQTRGTHTYTLTIFRDFNISKIRPRRPRLGKRTVETSLACASDYVLESN